MPEWFGDLSVLQIVLLIILVSVAGNAVAEIVRAFFQHRATPKRAAEFEHRLEGRLAQLEQTMEAMALDIERIAESQRFTARLLADPAARPQGAAPAGESGRRARDPEGVHVGG